MKKIVAGFVFGIIAGLIDLVPMILQKLTWDANLSAFCLWVVSGFLIASSSLKISGAVKGVVVSFLVLLPSAILIGWKEPFSLIPVSVMTLILGALLGFSIEKFGK